MTFRGEFATLIDLVGELACHFNTVLHNHLRMSKGEFATSPLSRQGKVWLPHLKIKPAS